MENKENNNPEVLEGNIDSKKRIDMFACEDGIKSIVPLKKLLLFCLGCFGMYAVALIVALFFNFLPIDAVSRESGSEFVIYFILLGGLLGILNKDLIKIKVDFSKWANWLIGIGIGIVVIVFPIIYTTIISLFYEYHISQNESLLREIIKMFPVLSVIVFGLVGPVCEELTYRVGLFGLLSKKKWLAYLAAILVFAFMHFGFTSEHIIDELVNLPIYLFSGAAFAIAYDKLGLAGSLSAHVLNNLYAIIMSIISNYIQ